MDIEWSIKKNMPHVSLVIFKINNLATIVMIIIIIMQL